MSQDLSQSSWEDPARHGTMLPRNPSYEQLEQELQEARAQSSRLLLEMEVLRNTYERRTLTPMQVNAISRLLRFVQVTLDQKDILRPVMMVARDLLDVYVNDRKASDPLRRQLSALAELHDTISGIHKEAKESKTPDHE